MSTLITVIIPAYNASSFLKAAVESVLFQTYQNWELIIVDDYSTDDTLELARSYQAQDKRISAIQTQTNSGGPATPRNVGLAVAKGRFVAFLDSENRLYRCDFGDRIPRWSSLDTCASWRTLVLSDYHRRSAARNQGHKKLH